VQDFVITTFDVSGSEGLTDILMCSAASYTLFNETVHVCESCNRCKVTDVVYK